jgi:hypothetical protein
MKDLIERLRDYDNTSTERNRLDMLDAANALERLTVGDVEMPFVGGFAISDRAHLEIIGAMQDYGDRRAAAAVLAERERGVIEKSALIAEWNKPGGFLDGPFI